jgi:hypothetical protein
VTRIDTVRALIDGLARAHVNGEPPSRECVAAGLALAFPDSTAEQHQTLWRTVIDWTPEVDNPGLSAEDSAARDRADDVLDWEYRKAGVR